MSSVDLPSIQTSFAPYPISSSSSPTTATALGFLSPAMTFQSRSYSTSSSSSSSSSLSTYTTSPSDRSLSVSPGPATPCDSNSRSPSFSHDSIYYVKSASLPNKHLFSPSSPQSSPQRYTSIPRHHPYHSPPHPHPQSKPYYPSSNFQDRSYCSQQYPPSAYSSFKALPSPLSPREMSSHSSRNHGDYHPSSFHHKQEDAYQQERHHGGSNNMDHSHRRSQVDYFQSRSPSTYPGYGCSSDYSLMTPKEEERDSPVLRPLTLSTAVSRSEHDNDNKHLMSPTGDDHYASSMSPSPSLSHAGSSFSRESSPSMDDDEYLGSMPEASASMSSLVSSSSSSSSSMSPMPTTQLLLCPVCNRAFKPSKNQNCNLRRHLKNVHNMSPAIHPRKCKWDSLPDGRVKDDKDRKERTRKSKRLWARKFRLRRKVEEAAVVLSMLSQAI
ncbi:hypothetical protein B0O80DRAFT_33856 [Mortierella sp. GBAus27b]|nr:hypothetical protein B0O80DRAFT_33856 [Mortierella sp. GBAus27b]